MSRISHDRSSPIRRTWGRPLQLDLLQRDLLAEVTVPIEAVIDSPRCTYCRNRQQDVSMFFEGNEWICRDCRWLLASPE